jgi:hypothetical protein
MRAGRPPATICASVTRSTSSTRGLYAAPCPAGGRRTHSPVRPAAQPAVQLDDCRPCCHCAVREVHQNQPRRQASSSPPGRPGGRAASRWSSSQGLRPRVASAAGRTQRPPHLINGEVSISAAAAWRATALARGECRECIRTVLVTMVPRRPPPSATTIRAHPGQSAL